jgi:hypothetical protein
MKPKDAGSKPGFQREMDGSVSEVEGEATLKDQMLACAERVIKATKTGNAELLVRAMFQLHEAIDQAIEEGQDMDEDEGEGERGEMLEDEGM